MATTDFRHGAIHQAAGRRAHDVSHASTAAGNVAHGHLLGVGVATVTPKSGDQGVKLPVLNVEVQLAVPQCTFVAPNPWMRACVRLTSGEAVCRLGFGVSPINDRIYIDGLSVEASHRRRGYATALVFAVAFMHRSAGRLLPITALHEALDGHAFWDALRAGRVAGLQVTKDVRASEVNGERQRWTVALMTDT